MKRIPLKLLLLMLPLSGCSLVPCNNVFPVAHWYWSPEAKECRAEHKAQEQWKKEHAKQNNL